MGNKNGVEPHILHSVSQGDLIVCGRVTQTFSKHSFEISGAEILLVAKEEKRRLLQANSDEHHLISLETDGELKITDIVYVSPNTNFKIFERTIRCKNVDCQISNIRCVLNRNVKKYSEPIVFVLDKHRLLENEQAHQRLFLAALHGYQPALDVFLKSPKIKTSTEVTKLFENQRKLLIKIQRNCK
jgi:hypothetical protein